MSASSTMVVLGQHQWTIRAMHLACSLARESGGSVIVVKMVRVNNPQLLGDAAGLVNYSTKDREALYECELTAADYAVRIEVHVCTYADYAAGIAQAAEYVDAAIVFAEPANSPFAAWNRFLQMRLRRVVGRPVYSLTTLDSQPSLYFRSTPSSGGSDRNDGGMSRMDPFGRTLDPPAVRR